MKYFLHYTYYRLYQWSQKREKNTPIVIVLAWITITSYANVYTLLALMDLCFGVYAERLMTIQTSGFTSLVVGSIWAFLVWVLLKIFRVEGKAFSREFIEKYKECGCKDWWIFVYFFVSMVAMIWVGWIAGALHRGGH